MKTNFFLDTWTRMKAEKVKLPVSATAAAAGESQSAPIFVQRMKSLSTRGVLAAVTVPGIVLLLFYSLALHMYWSLGGWPKSIGYRGFSSALVFHGELQFWAVKIVSVSSIFLWPAALVLCVAIPKARRFVPYLAVFAFAVLVCLGLMQLAPESYLNWWRD